MPETAFEDQVRETLRSQAETPMLWAGDPVAVSDQARRRLFRNVAASVAVGILVAVIVISSLPMGERSIPAHPPGPAVPRGDGKIAFAQGRDLYVIDSNGNEKTLVVHGCTGETCAIWSVAWSPQGTELVFAYYSEKNSTLGPRDGPLYLVRPDGSGLTALTDCRWPNCHDYSAAWSPDGRRIAFVRRGGQDGAGVVYVVGSDGSNLVPISSRGVAPVPPTWSPDGSRIAYVADYGRGRTRIEVAAADGTGHSILVDGSPAGDPYYPSWSPSGEKLAYSNRSGIWVVGTDGGSPERVLKSRGLTRLVTGRHSSRRGDLFWARRHGSGWNGADRSRGRSLLGGGLVAQREHARVFHCASDGRRVGRRLGSSHPHGLRGIHDRVASDRSMTRPVETRDPRLRAFAFEVEERHRHDGGGDLAALALDAPLDRQACAGLLEACRRSRSRPSS